MGAIKVTEDALGDVKKIAKKQGFSNGEVVALTARFILESGIDLKEGYSIKKEIKENNKRLSQVIAWQTKNEKDFVVPVFNEVQKNNELMKGYLEIIDPEKIRVTFNKLSKSFNGLSEEIKSSKIANEQIKRQLELSEKKNSILLGLISLERDYKGKIKDEESERELRSRLNGML
jgi:hypothetical protein